MVHPPIKRIHPYIFNQPLEYNDMTIEYNPQGVCSRHITVEVEDGIVKEIRFTGGCHGNTQGISALARGMKVNDVIDRCKGIMCGRKGTSCPDQLARALEENI